MDGEEVQRLTGHDPPVEEERTRALCAREGDYRETQSSSAGRGCPLGQLYMVGATGWGNKEWKGTTIGMDCPDDDSTGEVGMVVALEDSRGHASNVVMVRGVWWIVVVECSDGRNSACGVRQHDG